MMMCQNSDLFDINGVDKLNEDCVAQREELIKYHAKNEKAVFFQSHSGGKDSDASYETLKKLVPHDRIVVIHANLGAVEHNGVVEHIKSNIEHPLHIVKNELKDFIEMVLVRGMFPSSQFRECTSTLKTNPIDKFIRSYMKDHGYTHGFNVSGLRAEESAKRAMKNPLWINKRLTLTSGQRQVFDFMPVFHMTTQMVFDTIKAAGKRAHSAYGDRPEGGVNGNTRLSCIFCIMSNVNDLAHGAANYKDHYHEMIALEIVVDHTMFGKTRIIHSDVKHPKGTALSDGVVTKSKKNISSRAVMPYKNTVFIKVPLHEKIGAPVDWMLVKRHVKRLQDLKASLEREVIERKMSKDREKAVKAAKVGSKNKNRDESTIDFISEFGPVL